ncbi:MAG: polysaccharide biosynthesis C-terminal domain-containing protein [Desulfovibrionaceae bacterium]|nr:polysaccharide biosynthesis C-terminal domain-containing protein [Desulfovibrionaceae bacterium]MBF0514283.1 polysaccharide biosynthesis C-terminal domain-containing protein [Desulfovibrionaceae bacterium]
MTSQALDDIRKSTTIIIGLTFLDKLLALAKEVFFAYRFGVSRDLDVFNVAYAFPAVVALLLGQAAIAALVPLYPAWRSSGPRAAGRAISTVIWTSIGFFALLCLTCYAAAPTLFSLLGYGFEPESRLLGEELERLLVWLILLEGGSAMLAALLQAQKAFTALYSAQLCLNICLIGALWIWPGVDVRALAIGFLLGTGAKILVMIWTLRRGFSETFFTGPPDTKSLGAYLGLAWPLVIGGLVVNANIVVDQVMGTELSPGSVSALRYAYRINDLPIQLLVITMTRAIFPYVSEQAVNGDLKGMRQVFWRGVLFVIAVSLPVTAFVLLFSDQIVALLLMRGAFGPEAVGQTALTLVYYSLGMIFSSYAWLSSVFFNALRQNKTLMAVGVVTMLFNILFNRIFINLWGGPEGIAMSTTVTMGLTCLIFVLIINRALGVLRDLPRPRPFLLLPAVCILAYAAAWLVKTYAKSLGLDPLIAFAPLAVLFGVVYLGGLYRFGGDEIHWCLGAVLPFGKKRSRRL